MSKQTQAQKDAAAKKAGKLIKKYKVIGEIFPTDEAGTSLETALEIDSVQEVPSVIGDAWVKEGLAEEVKAPEQPKRVFRVFSDRMATVGQTSDEAEAQALAAQFKGSYRAI